VHLGHTLNCQLDDSDDVGTGVIVSSGSLMVLYVILINWFCWLELNFLRTSVLVCVVASYGHWRIVLL
jgi:hypothetical protein